MFNKKALLSVLVSSSLLTLSCDKKGAQSDWNDANPFFAPSTLAYQTADFSKIKNGDFKPALLEGMRQQLEEIEKITSNKEAATFENTLVELEKSGQLLTRVSNVFGLLTGADTNAELQKVEEELSKDFAAHSDAIYLNDLLFQRIKALYGQRENLKLDAESTRLLDHYYDAFVLAGADLSQENKERLKVINGEIAALNTQFSNQLLAATKAGGVSFTKDELEGLDENTLSSYLQKDGSYLISLINTTQQPDLISMSQKDARAKLFKASWSRAEKGDANDTRAAILELVKKRAEKAQLLGYQNYAQWSLKDQMAQTPEAVNSLLDQLIPASTAIAKAEAQDIQNLLNAEPAPFELTAADWDFYAEKIRKAKYNIDENETKPYFEVNTVLEKGVFYMAEQLYGITFKKRTDLPVWNEDVQVYELFNEDKTSIGLFYGDFYKRDSKRGGAWMSNIVGQSKLLNTKPVIYNVSNFTKPAAGQPALISFDDVTTLFHEFGHALHGFFADQTYPTLSGTNVSRDFVEFPSQFHEHFAVVPAVLKNYAIHYKTGEVMPEALLQKMLNAMSFNKGYAMTEMLAATSLDLAWHTLGVDATVADVDQFEQRALATKGLDLAQVPPRYRSSYFSHIFAGGYAAGYYAYLWAEMLDHDAYSWLEENGGMTRQNGQRLRDQVFSRGNSEELTKLYKNFRGQEPSINPMLKARGLVE
ncbi:M3 family metallopeptidase [Flavobacterium sp. JP2137]|uniref:M3 family metallopeptidase n=1 Tax=Flavobacterium sp. JP2137 TaxID=3414510 RepID=UPI003D2FC0AB